MSTRSFYDYDDYEIEVDRAYRDKRGKKAKHKRLGDDLVHGVVVRALGHHYEVQTTATDDDVEPLQLLCEVRGRLLQEKELGTLVAVGDRVWVRPAGHLRGMIERVEDRHSVLSRQQPGIDAPSEDVILANPDQALVVFSVAKPDPHLRMLDRFLVVAEANELSVLICVNKVELTGLQAAWALFDLYAQVGYRVLYTSAKLGIGVEELRDHLADRITVVTGPSGVGKSSLINAVHPDLRLKTGDLRDFLDKGKHTTRSAHLIPLPFGIDSFIADTPGIRELGLYDIDPANLQFYFREMLPFLHDCRYPNCTHNHEPECAVRGAVDAGKIVQARYDSYLRLLRGEE